MGGIKNEVTLDPFTDAEHDPLVYMVTMASGAELPTWLSFRSDLQRLSCLALEPNLGPLQLKLLVSDGVNDVVEGAFELQFNYVPEYTGLDPFSIEVKPNEV